MNSAQQHNDLLSDKELSDLTGVGLNERRREAKIVSVLEQAGIFHWWKSNGGIGTTWHHVHNARSRTAVERDNVVAPNFGAIR